MLNLSIIDPIYDVPVPLVHICAMMYGPLYVVSYLNDCFFSKHDLVINSLIVIIPHHDFAPIVFIY